MDTNVASYADAPGRAHTEDAQFFEYSTAANPIRASLTPRLPFHLFPASLYADGPSRVIPLDLSPRAVQRCWMGGTEAAPPHTRAKVGG